MTVRTIVSLRYSLRPLSFLAPEENSATCINHWALETEKTHAQMYAKAKGAVESGKDASFGEIWVCPVCGYTGEGPEPDYCPICNAKKSTFKKF